jgi:predicted nucleic acid-binding protein
MAINVQVLKEHRNALRAKLGLDVAVAHEATRRLFPWCSAPLDVAEVERAMTIERRYQTSWWDALIVASAVGGGCAYLLTEDAQASPVIAGVHVIDPATTQPEDILGTV